MSDRLNRAFLVLGFLLLVVSLWIVDESSMTNSTDPSARPQTVTVDEGRGAEEGLSGEFGEAAYRTLIAEQDVPTSDERFDSEVSGPSLVRVHGRVTTGGHALDGFDLSFVATDEAFDAMAEDWDSTDDDGGYEVQVPPGRYAVLDDDENSTKAMFVVPKGVEHRPSAEGECRVLLVEPAGVVNTGEAGGPQTAETDVWI